ncbi:MAG: bifunctional (p)ppGpp synthetase/guanosine-3',5'-bis(diphosphate) 3'-pyrophosphohydrolase [Pseudomonadota bacterium]|nr:MAG: bifunctional (p)ppGpp synthetase/guanosine-3',5'-bis(diphosphate) 3'-pyrophosphohydrolase [Pseudomonadota bacterium]
MVLVLKALHFAADKHRRQRRKDAAASPYINHPIALAEVLATIGGVRDAVTLSAAILHDTIEDTETTGQELEAVFGAEIRAIVEEVTDDTSQPPAVRKLRQIELARTSSPRARLVKLADKICNVRDLVEAPPAGWSLERRRRYVEWARAVIAEVCGCNSALELHFNALCERAMTHLVGSEPESER